MSTVDRRTLIKSALATGALAAVGPAVIVAPAEPWAKAIALLHDAVDRGHCGHRAFVAANMGPWAAARADGRALLAKLKAVEGCCADAIADTAERRVRGLSVVDADHWRDTRTAEEKLAELLETRAEYRRIFGIDAAPESPHDVLAQDVALHLLRHAHEHLALSALKALVHPRMLAPTEVLWHSVWRVDRSPESIAHPSLAALPERVVRQVRESACNHRSGKLRALCRQLLGQLRHDDVVSLLAFEAAGASGMLDQLPKRGPPSRELAREIFREAFADEAWPGAATVGIALLRERSSFERLKHAFGQMEFRNHAGICTAAAMLCLLRYEEGLPILCRTSSATARLAEDHFCCEGQVFPIGFDFDEPFPFRLRDRHEALRHMDEAELKAYAPTQASYLHRTEATIELAHRPGARRFAGLFEPMLSDAAASDVVRLIDTLTWSNPRLGAELGRRALDHRDWEVRTAAAAAVLKRGLRG